MDPVQAPQISSQDIVAGNLPARINEFTRSVMEQNKLLVRRVQDMEVIQRSQGVMLTELLKVTRGHRYSEA